jgi:hypothetical protein
MPAAYPILTNFTGGEFSPLLRGRVDFEKYYNACATLENMIVHPHGGATRRPGTYFVAEVEDSSKATRLIPFEYSTEQAYMLEFGDQKMRVFMDNGSVLESAKSISGATQAKPVVITATGHEYANGEEIYISGVVGMTELNGRRFIVANKDTNTFELNDKDGNEIDGTGYTEYTSGGNCYRVYEIATPYLEADLFEIQVAQEADVMYLAHPDYTPRKLSRTGHTNWTLEEVDYLDGPFLPEQTDNGITPDGTTGSITLTADSALWDDPGDINRLVRLKYSDTWYWLKITAVSSTTVCTATVKGTDLPGTNKCTTFRLGYWSNGLGFPGSVSFHEQRLWWAGSKSYPQTKWASKTADYENYAEQTDATADIADDDPLIYTIATEKMNAICWLSAGKILMAGTFGGEFSIQGSSINEAITPTNVQVWRESTYGGARLQPQKIGHSTFFLQRARRWIMNLHYDYNLDGYDATDMTILSEHITRGGIVDMSYQQNPDSILWCVRSDGVLLGMTYLPQHDVIAWHRHTTEGEFESVATIPADTYDQVWVVVKRTINEVTRRYIEYFKPMDWGDDQEDCFFVDCGLTYDGSATKNIGGAFHLAGETVTVLADGAAHPDRAVDASGDVAELNYEASVVHVGFSYNSILETMPLEPTGAQGLAQSRLQQISELVIRFYKTLGCQFGRDANHLDVLPFGPSVMDQPPPLFTGKKTMGFSGVSSDEAVVYILQDQPLPLSVLGIYAKEELADA